jgi:hypothetical protein
MFSYYKVSYVYGAFTVLAEIVSEDGSAIGRYNK